jgi:hypothetical protein
MHPGLGVTSAHRGLSRPHAGSARGLSTVLGGRPLDSAAFGLVAAGGRRGERRLGLLGGGPASLGENASAPRGDRPSRRRCGGARRSPTRPFTRRTACIGDRHRRRPRCSRHASIARWFCTGGRTEAHGRPVQRGDAASRSTGENDANSARCAHLRQTHPLICGPFWREIEKGGGGPWRSLIVAQRLARRAVLMRHCSCSSVVGKTTR